MRETQLGIHTVRSHGLALARKHKFDWLTLVLLGAIDVTLYFIRPVYPILGRAVMENHKFPIKSDIVPFWAVPMYAVFLPIAIFIFFYFRRRDVYDLHHAILGLLFSILLTAVITNALQDVIGRPRPNFFWHCFPDGKENYDRWGNAVCHGDAADIKRARESFPSGHVSWSSAGMVFLSLYLSGKIKAFDHEGHVAKLCIIFLPLLVATVVAASRLDDYTHHIEDVLAGGLIGLIVGVFCHLQLFPPPYHPEGWGPYAYFQALEESYAGGQVTNTRNGQLGA